MKNCWRKKAFMQIFTILSLRKHPEAGGVKKQTNVLRNCLVDSKMDV